MPPLFSITVFKISFLLKQTPTFRMQEINNVKKDIQLFFSYEIILLYWIEQLFVNTFWIFFRREGNTI